MHIDHWLYLWLKGHYFLKATTTLFLNFPMQSKWSVQLTLPRFKENYFLNWDITGNTFFKYICQVLTFTMNAHPIGWWYAGWYRWLISKADASANQKECMRACYSSNLLATGSISSLIVEFAWRSAPPPHTSSLLKIKLRWAASSIFYLFSKGYIYVQRWHVDASSMILVDPMRRNF